MFYQALSPIVGQLKVLVKKEQKQMEDGITAHTELAGLLELIKLKSLTNLSHLAHVKRCTSALYCFHL